MRYKLTLEYDGTGYAGWQVQKNHMSIQQALEEAITAFCGVHCPTITAGRTDAGVHALAQVAHADLPREYDDYSVMQGINFHLLGAGHVNIAVINAEAVDDQFNARFSATQRYYRYRIINRRSRLAIERDRAWQVGEELNIEAMQQAANLLLGHHDFSSFRDSECQAKSPLRTLDNLNITKDREHITITTDARSFLHHQVRIMTGTLVDVGKGKLQVEDIKTILEAKNRTVAGPTAPAHGLYLAHVQYGDQP